MIFYNQAYIKLWNPQKLFLDSEPNLDDILNSQRDFFDKDEDWGALKEKIVAHILSMTTKSFVISRSEHETIMISSCNLSDGSMMITYKKGGE